MLPRIRRFTGVGLWIALRVAAGRIPLRINVLRGPHRSKNRAQQLWHRSNNILYQSSFFG